MPAEQLFETALQGVESASIRSWAASDRNRGLWLQYVQNLLDEAPHKANPEHVALQIVVVAIGL